MSYPKGFNNIKPDIATGKYSCTDLAKFYLANIEANLHLNAFLEIYKNEVLQKASELDTRIKGGEKVGKLAGMFIGLKDNICYKNHKVSASSKILEGFESLYSATVTERLIAEDAIIIGRCNCDEFAMGASNENSAYGPVLNAQDNSKVSGGSSGGAAVAVQANLCTATLGSDTGGSVRQPAAFTGNFGIKPTYGRVSRYGLLAYASSLDQIGPITSTIEDMALLMEIISGDDGMDATASEKPVESYSTFSSIKPKTKIAYLENYVNADGVQPEVKNKTLEIVEKLKKAGHTVEAVSFDLLEYLVPCYYVITTAEASSNLSRYSGILYGYRSPNSTDLESTIKKSRSEGFGEEVKRRIMAGTFVLSSDYYDAYYSKAQKVRREIADQTKSLFLNYDFVINPTTPTTAFELGGKISDPIAMYLADIFTVQAPLAGNPAISIPAGVDNNGMPMGVQVMTDLYKEKDMLNFAKYLSELIHS
ncbi:MAG: Asp-tRNA(Asn)/Glu-tRNA(Gln) amidotransferase subunit GatA [Bacteroidia bacterium]